MGIWSVWKYGLVFESVQIEKGRLGGCRLRYNDLFDPAGTEQADGRSRGRRRRVFFYCYRDVSWILEKHCTVVRRGDLLRILLYGNDDVGDMETYFHEKEKCAISPVSNAGRNMAGYFINKRLKASYTIEAAYVMAVVLLSLAAMILAAYQIHDETAGAMAVQQAVEKLTHLEEEDRERDIPVRNVYLKDAYDIWIEADAINITGKGTGRSWKLEITTKKYDPERFLRLVSMAEEGILNNRE